MVVYRAGVAAVCATAIAAGVAGGPVCWPWGSLLKYPGRRPGGVIGAAGA